MKRLKGPFGSSRVESEKGGEGGVAQKRTTSDALTYLKEVREMFQDELEKYNMFLGIMKDFKSQRVDTEDVINRVKELFKEHSNLIYGFNAFLPKQYEITIVEDEPSFQKKKEDEPVDFEEAISFVNKIKKRFQNDERVYKKFLKILNMYRKELKVINDVYDEVAVLFNGHPDLLDGFIRFMPNKEQCRRDTIIGSNMNRDAAECNDVKDDKTMVNLRKEQRRRAEKETRERGNCEHNHRELEHESNNNFNMRVNKKNKSITKDKDAIKCTYKQEYIFFEKVKERMGSEDEYQDFLKCLHIYSTEVIPRKELQRLVVNLLGKYPDLLEGFNDLLNHCENIDGFLARFMTKKPSGTEGPLPRLAKIEEREKEKKREAELAKENIYNEKYLWKSIQELDLSSCKRCTPSYRLLPEDYPIPSASRRSELGAHVLNDNWVSVTSGSEDYSFKHMRRNQYEESLFRCEDDRFELDMLLESVNATIKRAEELLNCLDNNTINLDNHIPLEDYFTAINLRCIERLYGDHGLDVNDILRKTPSVALPVILTRLKQKQEEWNKCRVDFNKVWADIYAKNHDKSLDHRSFYFKQQDSKNLNTKALISEIKDIKEKTQYPDHVVLAAISAGSRHNVCPIIEFEYSDSEIHEDLYKLVKYSCEEVCTTREQFNKVIRLWTTFLEPMLGINSRPSSSDGIDEDEEAKSSAEKKNTGNINTANEDSFDLEKKSIDERFIDASASLTLLANNIHKNDGHGLSGGPFHTDDNNKACSDIKGANSSEGGSISRTVPLANGIFRKSKNVEKEEGELSPNVDFEEDNFAVFGDNGSLAIPTKTKQADDVKNEKNSEKEDVSGSESANDDCSREEDEEQEEREGEERDGTSALNLENFVKISKPLVKHVSSTSLPGNAKKDCQVFYGSDAFYVLFRLHQVLYDRLLSAKLNSTAAETDRKTEKDSDTSDLYGRFITALYSLLDGSIDNAKYEDDCRDIIGNKSYELFTLDKLIYKLVKQLQTVSGDETDNKLLQLFEYENSRTQEKYVDRVYFDNVHIVLHDENIYRVESNLQSSAPFRLSIQLMDDGNDKLEVCLDSNFSAYLDNEYLSIISSKKEPPNIFLKRNKRKYAGLDESSATCKALDDVHLVNGLDCRMSCTSSKIEYVFATEDFFYRMKRRKASSSHDQAKIERFNKFLSAA